MKNNIQFTSAQNHKNQKKKFGQKFIISIFSGLIGTLVGTLISIGYQHFFVKPQTQSFTFIYNGEEVVVTEADYVSQEKQNELLQNELINLQDENQQLKNKNDSYFNDISNLKEQISNNEEEIQLLASQASASPILSFSNMKLSINGDNIPINPKNSMVTIDGQDYFTKEIVNNLIDENENMTIKDNTIFIGKHDFTTLKMGFLFRA